MKSIVFLVLSLFVVQGIHAVERLEKPNIIVLITDQERHPMHWPKGWAEEHLISNQRLKKHGLTYNRAYTSACM